MEAETFLVEGSAVVIEIHNVLSPGIIRLLLGNGLLIEDALVTAAVVAATRLMAAMRLVAAMTVVALMLGTAAMLLVKVGDAKTKNVRHIRVAKVRDAMV